MSIRPPIALQALADTLREAGLLLEAAGDLALDVPAIAHDSRAVAPGACFVAVRGDVSDGHRFLGQAVALGAAAAIVAEMPAERPEGLRAVLRVRDTRAALAVAAVAFFGRSSERLDLVGVTGTNGKTTTTYLLHHALAALGRRPGLIGTIEVRIGERRVEATHTTPDALALNALLAEMAEAGCSACAMEVSSHALHQERVRGQRFAAGVFTNLTHDHLDYHGSFEAYRAAKARLFEGLDAGAAAVVNADDPGHEAMIAATKARVWTFGRTVGGPGLHPERSLEGHVGFAIEANALSGLSLRLDGAVRRFRLAGAFNAYNLAAAYTVLRALGTPAAEALDALVEAPAVPGRLETIRPADLGFDAPGPIGVVDYAHTPDALENVLETVRTMLPEGGKLHVVFGCGGDRDRAKRPIMGYLAATHADRVVLTSDNPRSEDPAAILAAIEAGMKVPPAHVEPDRAAAIRAAIASAEPSDAVVVAGKGHETYQIVGASRHPFDDRTHVRAALRARLA